MEMEPNTNSIKITERSQIKSTLLYIFFNLMLSISNRTKSMAVNGSVSQTAKVVSGVPKGTVIGPILFIIFINDKVQCVGSTIRFFSLTIVFVIGS